MPLKLYNTYTRRLEDFAPVEPGVVRMYNCGPTVYSYTHIGNLRSFLFADTLRRVFEHRGWRVRQVMNITDVGHLLNDSDDGEDRTAIAAEREKKDPWELTRFYADYFLALLKEMNFLPAEVNPRATGHIPEMIAIIENLIAKGYAYVVNRAVYFDIAKFPAYGRLSGNTPEQLQEGAGGRVGKNPDKRNPMDFALWKHDPRHIMQWDSPWGPGFPGWHIECSAMSMKYLGETLDIHTGGEDNIFPHHECEIAQSEAANGKPFVRLWCHVRHLLVNGQKMSKSLNNFYTVKDVFEKGANWRALRYLLVRVNYRVSLDFTFETLDNDRKALRRLEDFRARIDAAPPSGATPPEAVQRLAGYRQRFEASLDDDINMSEALGALFLMVNEANRLIDEGRLDAGVRDQARSLLGDAERILGIPFQEEQKLVPEEEALIREREEARKRRDFKRADELRAELKQRGLVIEDSPGGTRWKRV